MRRSSWVVLVISNFREQTQQVQELAKAFVPTSTKLTARGDCVVTPDWLHLYITNEKMLV